MTKKIMETKSRVRAALSENFTTEEEKRATPKHSINPNQMLAVR